MGFGQELKDFVTSFQAGYKMADDAQYKQMRGKYLQAQIDKANDPLDKRIKEARLKGIETRNSGGTPSQRHMQSLKDDATRMRYEDEKEVMGERREKRQEDREIRAGTRLPRDLEQYPFAPIEPVYSRAVPVSRSEEGYSSGFARGGLVKRVKTYEDGGVVEDEDEDEEEYDADTVGGSEDATYPTYPEERDAIPAVTRSSAISTSADQRSRSLGRGGADEIQAAKPRLSHAAAQDAASDGLNETLHRFGLDETGAIRSPERQQGMERLVRSEGAASNKMMDHVRNAIDPDKKLSESERNMAALGGVYEFHLSRGDRPAAQRASSQMMQYFRKVNSHYNALSQAAEEKGDIDGAVKASVRAYASIPDGMDVTLAKNKDGKLTYSYIDEQTGKVMDRGIVSPIEMLKMARQGQELGFDGFVTRAAGKRAEAPPSDAFKSAIKTLGDNDGKINKELLGEMSAQEQNRYLQAQKAMQGPKGKEQVNKYLEYDYEERIPPIRDAINTVLGRAIKHDASGKVDSKATPLAKMKEAKLDHLTEDFERVADKIVAKGYKGDMRSLASFVADYSVAERHNSFIDEKNLIGYFDDDQFPLDKGIIRQLKGIRDEAEKAVMGREAEKFSKKSAAQERRASELEARTGGLEAVRENIQKRVREEQRQRSAAPQE